MEAPGLRIEACNLTSDGTPGLTVLPLVASPRFIDLEFALVGHAVSGPFGSGGPAESRRLTCHLKPPALVLNEPRCYHFRALDPRLPLRTPPGDQGWRA
jgi:hypothetical protein